MEQEDTITMTILIAKVYKKEMVFYPQKDIYHQEQNQDGRHPLKVMSTWYPQTKTIW